MNKLISLLVIILTGFVAYFPSLKYGFSQDDFIHLYSSKASNIGEFLNFFNPFYHFPDIFFYRPLATQVYFFLNQSLFGLNPLPFHLEGLFLHLMNSILFYFLVKKLWQNPKIAFLSAFFYTISAAHFLSLYYISAFQEIARILFILLSLLSFLKFQETGKNRMYILSLLTFTASILSKETSLITPLLLIPLSIMARKEQKVLVVIKSTLKLILPFLVIILIYTAVRLAGFQSIFNEGSYDTTFAFSGIIQNLKWYLIWSFGLPEVLSNYPSLKPASLIQFSKDLPYGSLLILFFTFLMLISSILIYRLKNLTKRAFFASTAIFFISLGPVLVLSGHRYPQYLDLAFIGLLPLLSWIYLKQEGFQKGLGVLGIVLFISLQFLSISANEQTHWTTHRAKVASYYHENIKRVHPTLPKNSVVTFVGSKQSSYQLSLALAQKYALLTWYPGLINSVRFTDQSFLSREAEIIIPVTIF